MHTVPPRPGELGQVRAGQRVEYALGLLNGRAGERGGGMAGKVKTRVQAQQPEHAGGCGVQVLTGPGEHGPHRGAGVPASIQQV